MGQQESNIQFLSSARTDKGKVRQNNEDNIDLWASRQYVMAVVADGMGGAVAGERASKIAIDTVRDQLIDDDHQCPEDYAEDDETYLIDRLSGVVRHANRNIYDTAVQFPKLKGMGTTMTLAFMRRSELNIIHVGDSRAYRVNGTSRTIEQLTSDHSFVQALIDAGHITPAEAEKHPMRNVLYRALGQTPDIDVDTYTDLHLHIGDWLVLCSDGLTLHVKANEIAETVIAYNHPQTASQKLIDLANARGGKDNISVIVVKAETTQILNYAMDEEFDEATAPMPRYDDTDTIEIVTHPSDDDDHAYNAAYGEGRDTNIPAQ